MTFVCRKSDDVLELRILNAAALDTAAPQILEALGSRRKVALYGDMGAGKTTLIKALCRQLGVTDATSSPTFSLVNQYAYTDPEGRPALLHHLDLYRLQRIEEALDIGVEELLYDPWYCFIEWPQLIEPLLPPDTAKIQLEPVAENERRLLIL